MRDADRKGSTRRKPYVVDALARALVVLSDVLGTGRVVTLAEVVRSSNLPKSTIYRYLRTFVASGYLDHDESTDTYAAGTRFLSVASAAVWRDRLRQVARPAMARLVRTLGHTANLGVLEGGKVVYLDIVKTRRHSHVEAAVGVSHPAHATSLGKAILAFLPSGERSEWLRRPLNEQTGRTIFEPRVLERELRQIAALGYAMEVEENEPDAMCVGVPILLSGGYPFAAISLTMATSRRGAPSLSPAITELQRSAAGVSATLNTQPALHFQSEMPDSDLDRTSPIDAR